MDFSASASHEQGSYFHSMTMHKEPRELDIHEADGVIQKSSEAFLRMRKAESMRPAPILEKYIRPLIKRALLRIRRDEAKRCQAYGQIGSPRVLELEAELNQVEFEIAEAYG